MLSDCARCWLDAVELRDVNVCRRRRASLDAAAAVAVAPARCIAVIDNDYVDDVDDTHCKAASSAATNGYRRTNDDDDDDGGVAAAVACSSRATASSAAASSRRSKFAGLIVKKKNYTYLTINLCA